MQERRSDNAFSIFVIINLCAVSRVGFVWDIIYVRGNNCALFGEKRVKLSMRMRTSGNGLPTASFSRRTEIHQFLTKPLKVFSF